MNIFILSYKQDWLKHMQEQRHSHADKHVIKMITESVQMLSTALASQTFRDNHPNITQLPATAISYEKHPCTLWAKDNLHNFTYLAHLALNLCYEKQYRWPLNHAHAYQPWLETLCEQLPTYAMVPDLFPVAIPDSEHATKLTGIPANLDTAADLYQRYYATHKADIVGWKRRVVPVWYLIEQEILERKRGNN